MNMTTGINNFDPSLSVNLGDKMNGPVRKYVPYLGDKTYLGSKGLCDLIYRLTDSIVRATGRRRAYHVLCAERRPAAKALAKRRRVPILSGLH